MSDQSPTSIGDPFAAIEHFKAIVQSSDDAIISKTLQGIVTSWNPAAQRIFGYSAEEMIGRPMLTVFPKGLEDEEARILQRIVRGEKVDHFETRRVRKDGQAIQVEVTISPVHDAQGHIVGASKIARDITQRKAVQERLKLLSNVFTHTTEAVVITDAQGCFLEVNKAFTEMTGYSREEALGQNLLLFKSSRQGPEVYQRLWDDLQATGHCQGEVWSRRQDGGAFAGLLTISCVTNKQGQPSKYVANFADITELRLHQERLEHIANFDPLTGLPNRLLLSDRLTQALAHAKRHHKSVAVVYLDLDGFKAINDQHGHGVGDALLQQVAKHLQAAIRDVDTAARMGGDEFVVVLGDVDSEHGLDAVLKRLLAACTTPMHLNGLCLQVSGSLGVTVYPQDDSDATDLMRHADQAMYDAKQSGKNRIHEFDARTGLRARGTGGSTPTVSVTPAA
jgi:diguanylate cyclase (GGDEF)-like protein/PAS domain S-box-containing protein